MTRADRAALTFAVGGLGVALVATALLLVVVRDAWIDPGAAIVVALVITWLLSTTARGARALLRRPTTGLYERTDTPT